MAAESLELGLRTRGRSQQTSGCHTPGCRNRALDRRRFCKSCQATLDRVRDELAAASQRGRKRAVGKAALRKRA